MAPKSTNIAFSHPLEVAKLSRQKVNEFDLRPESDSVEQLISNLGLTALRKLSFSGKIEPVGKRDWRLQARLGATIVQPCVVSLAPVTTRIDEDVERIWRADMTDTPHGSEEEMPEDTRNEPLGPILDPGKVLVEVLTLAVPQYPRAKDATLEKNAFSAPGIRPMQDEDARPFAGLAGFRDKLAGDREND